MWTWILVGVGGAIGSVARHGVNKLALEYWPMGRFPIGTTIVNMLGCCIIGVLAGLVASGRLPLRLQVREFVFVGILGGFTTFSTFGLETVTLLKSGSTAVAFASVAAQIVGGIGGVFGGLMLCERVRTL